MFHLHIESCKQQYPSSIYPIPDLSFSDELVHVVVDHLSALGQHLGELALVDSRIRLDRVDYLRGKRLGDVSGGPRVIDPVRTLAQTLDEISLLEGLEMVCKNAVLEIKIVHQLGKVDARVCDDVLVDLFSHRMVENGIWAYS